MIKRKTVETTKEYDADGRLIKETVVETTEDDDSVYYPYTVNPCTPAPWWSTPTCVSASTVAQEQNI